MTKSEYAAVRIPKQTHLRLLALKAALEGRVKSESRLRADVTLGSVIESAIDALEAELATGSLESGDAK